MATSTFPVAKASIVAAVTNDPGMVGVEVDYGDPGLKLAREHVFFGGTLPDTQVWGPFGQRKRDETFGLMFWVHVGVPGLSQQDATERAHVLFGVIETLTRALAGDTPSVAPGMYAIEVQPSGVDEYVTDEGHACVIAGVISCKARI